MLRHFKVQNNFKKIERGLTWFILCIHLRIMNFELVRGL